MKDLNNMVFLTDLIFWNKETTSKIFGTSLTINHSYKMYVIINFVKLSKWITSFILCKPPCRSASFVQQRCQQIKLLSINGYFSGKSYMSFFSFFQTNCVNVPLAIICTPKWISVGKFIAFNESCTYLARFVPCCRAYFNFLFRFPKSMSIQRRGIFMLIFYIQCYFVEFQSPVSWATVRGPSQILYLAKV